MTAMEHILLITLLTVVSVLSVSAVAEEESIGHLALDPIDTVTTDAQGRFVVNDKLFFPVLLYSPKFDDDSLRMFAAHGFNALSVTHRHIELTQKLREMGLYSMVHAGRPIPEESLPGVLIAIGMDSPVLNWKDQWRDKLPAHTETIRANAPGRPIMSAIGYWGVEDLEALRSNTILGEDDYEGLICELDVAAPYLYPVPYQSVASVADAVNRAREATGGTRPVLPVLQLFRWTADARYPTPAELHCMAHLALIHGATGIGYYSFSTVIGERDKTVADAAPELWASVKPLNAEVHRVGLFLISSKPDDAVRLKETPPGIHFRAARSGEKSMILLTNAGDSVQTVHLVGSAEGQVTLQPLESRVIEQ